MKEYTQEELTEEYQSESFTQSDYEIEIEAIKARWEYLESFESCDQCGKMVHVATLRDSSNGDCICEECNKLNKADRESITTGYTRVDNGSSEWKV